MLRAIKKIVLEQRYKYEQKIDKLEKRIYELEDVINKDREKVHCEQTLTYSACDAIYAETRKLENKKDKNRMCKDFWDKLCKLLKAEIHKYEYELSFKTRTVTIVSTDWYDAEKQRRKLYKKTGIHGEFKRELE